MDSGNREGVIMPVSVASGELPEEYTTFLDKIKKQIRSERLKAVLAANSALMMKCCGISDILFFKNRDAALAAVSMSSLSFACPN